MALRYGGALTTNLRSFSNFRYPGGLFRRSCLSSTTLSFWSCDITPPPDTSLDPMSGVCRKCNHRVADALKHEPCGPLRNLKGTGNLVGTDPVLAISDKPHSAEPFVQTDCGILQDRADLHGELFSAVKAGPQQACSQKRKPPRLTPWARWTFWPPLRNGDSIKTDSWIGEIANHRHQTVWNLSSNLFHNLSIGRISV